MICTFDALNLIVDKSMVNFPQGYATALDTVSSVYNSPSRVGGVVVKSTNQSTVFTGVYTIMSDTDIERMHYNAIKDLEGTIGTLIINTDVIPNVLLKSVSTPSELGNSVLQCNLIFEKVL